MRPQILAHRGASGHQLENSRAAFRRAVQLEADGVELDVHATRDGALVVHHDPEVPGWGPIARLTLEQLAPARLPNGEPLPLLTDVLEIMGDRVVWIEVKALDPAFDAALLAAVDGAPAPRACGVHSFEHRIVERLGRARPDLRLGALLAARVMDPSGVLAAARARVLWQEWRMIDASLVEQVHSAGHEIVAWTVDAAREIDRLARLGVDAICTNFPDRARTALGPGG